MVKKSGSGKEYEALVEAIIERSCKMNKLAKKGQSNVGEKPGGGNHIIDWELWEEDNPSKRALLSCKIQTTAGTAEEKIAYEVVKLLHTMDFDPRFRFGWIVLGGNGWNNGLLDYYLKELPTRLPSMVGRIQILRTDDLISLNLIIP